MTFSETVGIFVKLLLIYTPFFVMSIFITVTTGMDTKSRRKLAISTGIAIAGISVAIYMFGQEIFYYLGISTDAFRIGTGLVLVLSGLDCVRASGVPEARKIKDGSLDMAVVPLALPYTIGPGTLATLLVLGAEPNISAEQRLFTTMAIVLAAMCVGLILIFAPQIEKLIKRKGVSVLTKMTGLYLVALAMQITFDGIRGLLHIS